MCFRLIMLMVICLFFSLSSQAQNIAGVSPPQTLAPQGETLQLASCGAREMLWMDLYAIALYLPRSDMSQKVILSADTPKAVILYPVYDGKLPQNIPQSWRRRLEARLTQSQMKEIQQLYKRMHTGDTATIAYKPGGGTLFRINDKTIDTRQGSDLMDGVLGAWLGGGGSINLMDMRC